MTHLEDVQVAISVPEITPNGFAKLVRVEGYGNQGEKRIDQGENVEQQNSSANLQGDAQLNGPGSPVSEDLREVLKRLVVDEPDLELLEDMISGFNVFEAMGMVDQELRAPNKTVERSSSRSKRIQGRGTLGGHQLDAHSVPSAVGSGSAKKASVPLPIGAVPIARWYQCHVGRYVP